MHFNSFLFVFISVICGCSKSMYSPKDLTSYLQEKIDKNDTVYLENKKYQIYSLKVGSNKTIIGKGEKTEIEKANTSRFNKNEPVFNIVGKNVIIKNVSVKGNIVNDEGEWNPAFAITPNNENINNVIIENVQILDVRGDGIYIGSHNEFTCSDIFINNIKVKNWL